MKHLLFLSSLLFIGIFGIAQCRVQSNEREDGVTIRYLRPDRIGRSDKFMFAVSLQTDGKLYYVATLCVFEFKAEKLQGNMVLKFANNKSSTFAHFQSSITTFNGYPATISIFVADENDIKNISSSNLKYAMMQMESNVYQNVSVIMNGDLLKKQYACLTQ